MNQHILFLPLHTASMLEMMPVAEKIVKDGKYQPVFFVFRGITRADVAHLQAQGYRTVFAWDWKRTKRHSTVHPAPAPVIAGTRQPQPSRASKVILRKILKLPLLSFMWYLLMFGTQLFQARRWLLRQQIQALVLIGDRHVGWETAFIKAANRLHIPSMIVPFAVSDQLVGVEFRRRHPAAENFLVDSWFNRLIQRLYPKWVLEVEGECLFFSPPAISLAAKLWGMMPDNPWSIGGGAASCMAVESQELERTFIGQGLPADKILVTGKPSNDALVNEIQPGSLRPQLGIASDRPIILCSLPQMGEHGFLSWPEHWREIEFLLDTLTRQDIARVVISLHPKSNLIDYQPFLDKYPVLVPQKRIYEMIPDCDLFVATYSSTVIQAMGFGKPAVVVDFYNLNWTFYDQEPGIRVIRDRSQLLPEVRRFLTDSDYYQQLAGYQRQRASQWILLDGGCTQRVVDRLYSLMG